MITREQAEQRAFELDLQMVQSLTPDIDPEQYKTVWYSRKHKPEQQNQIDSIWEILLELETTH
jgi:hypothetical protein